MEKKAAEEFDPASCPLDKTNLIESSAGTGKTFAITRLYIRFLIEKKLPAEKILVVTFTEASKSDLISRIRSTIKDSLDIALRRRSEDKAETSLFAIVSRQDTAQTVRLLSAALQSFDEYSVLTIHGFCRKILKEYAFEAGEAFETEVIPDQSLLIREAVMNFWRTRIVRLEESLIEFLLSQKITPDSLADFYQKCLQYPGVQVHGAQTSGALPDRQLLIKLFLDVREEWKSSREKILQMLESPDLRKNIFRKTPESLPRRAEDMDIFLAGSGPFSASSGRLDFLENFTASKIRRYTNAGRQPPVHRFFDLAEDLNSFLAEYSSVLIRRLAELHAEMIVFCENYLSEKKKAARLVSYDDLLLRTRSRLSSEVFVQAVSSSCDAVMVDEFQDTDSAQWEILRTIFTGNDRPFFLIGDPKQSIYRFRGADIHAYIEARAQADRLFTLRTSYRSDRELIEAVNAVFSEDTPGGSFLYPEIPFHTMNSSKSGPSLLNTDEDSRAAFELWFLPDEKARSLPEARGIFCSAMASEIISLIEKSRAGKAAIGNIPLRLEDMAVIVRTNAEADLVRDEFLSRGIPAILRSEMSVLKSEEAEQIQVIMDAVENPKRIALIKTALAAAVPGWTGMTLQRTFSSEMLEERTVKRFLEYRKIWQEKSFAEMFACFLRKDKLSVRLLRIPGGERKLTNLTHIAELISGFKEPSLEICIKKFQECRKNPFNSALDHLQRPENEDSAVQIITAHKAKGLEFPIVFCPFTWSQPGESEKIYRKDRKHFVIPSFLKNTDLENDPEMENIQSEIKRESLAEDIRLLYVAVTRSIHRCHFGWGRLNSTQNSAAAFLLHAGKGADISRMNNDEFLSDLQLLEKKSHQSIKVRTIKAEKENSRLPALSAKKALQIRKRNRSVKKNIHINSFTSIVSGIAESNPQRERIMNHTGGSSSGGLLRDPAAQAPALKPGIETGIFLHSLFEDIDFTDPEEILKSVILNKLDFFNMYPDLAPVVYRLLDNVLHTPLYPELPDFTLATVRKSDRLTEMEFYYPVDNTPDRSIQRGYMKGYIDCVFRRDEKYFIIDWKSNYLGETHLDYSEESLREAMEKDSYILQYRIYLRALDAWLKNRLPDYKFETHIGGILYLFVRGMDRSAGAGFGIFRDKPDRSFIERLESSANTGGRL